MTFQVGLLTPVFTQHMGPFNSLFLTLAAGQPAKGLYLTAPATKWAHPG